MDEEHVLRVIDASGDSKTIWDPENEAEVAAAKATFEALKKKKYLAYEVKKGGEPGKLLDEFDPKLGKIIMRPPIMGG